MDRSQVNDLQSVLYPYQRQFCLDRSKFQIWVASRQIGKSFGVACKAVQNALAGQNYIIMSTSMRNARRLIKTCKKVIRAYEAAARQPIALEVDNKDEIVFAQSKGTILSIASNPETAVGETGHLILDEASRFKRSDEIMDAVMPFITRGFSLTMVSTPLGKRGMFWDAYKKALEPSSNWSLHIQNVYEAIAQGCPVNVDMIREEMDEISFRQNYMCEFIDDQTAFFSFDLILSVVNSDLENMTFKQMEDTKTFKIAGYDPGKIVDSGVFTVMTKDAGGKKKVIHIKEFKQIDYSEQIAYIVNACRTCNIPKLYIDATGVGVKLYEDLKRALGSIAQPITYTNAVKEQLVTDLKLDMERKEVELPEDSRLFDQLHGIEREITAAGNTRYTHDQSKHDDIVMAICNALSGFSRKGNIDLSGIHTGGGSVFDRL